MAMRLLRSLANNVSTAAAPFPGLSSGTMSAFGQRATSVRTWAVSLARIKGLVRSRSGALQNDLSPAAALRERRSPTGVSGLAASSGQRRGSRSKAIAWRMINNSMALRRGCRRLDWAGFCEFRAQLLPFFPHLAIARCIAFAGLLCGALMVLCQAAHEE